MNTNEQSLGSIYEQAKLILDGLEPEIGDAIYDLVHMKYIKADALQKMSEESYYKDFSDETKQMLADRVAERYAIDGDYDCDMSYWDNIYNLLHEETEALRQDISSER